MKYYTGEAEGAVLTCGHNGSRGHRTIAAAQKCRGYCAGYAQGTRRVVQYDTERGVKSIMRTGLPRLDGR